MDASTPKTSPEHEPDGRNATQGREPAPSIPQSWLARHAVEVTAAAAILAIVAAASWVILGGPSQLPKLRAASPAGATSDPMGTASQAANQAALWVPPAAPQIGAVCRIDTGSISAHILQQVLKTAKWAPITGQIGQYVGLALKVEANQLAAKGWVVLSSSGTLAVPQERDFTAQVEASVLQSLQAQIPMMLAQLPAGAATTSTAASAPIPQGAADVGAGAVTSGNAAMPESFQP